MSYIIATLEGYVGRKNLLCRATKRLTAVKGSAVNILALDPRGNHSRSLRVNDRRVRNFFQTQLLISSKKYGMSTLIVCSLEFFFFYEAVNKLTDNAQNIFSLIAEDSDFIKYSLSYSN